MTMHAAVDQVDGVDGVDKSFCLPERAHLDHEVGRHGDEVVCRRCGARFHATGAPHDHARMRRVIAWMKLHEACAAIAPRDVVENIHAPGDTGEVRRTQPEHRLAEVHWYETGELLWWPFEGLRVVRRAD